MDNSAVGARLFSYRVTRVGHATSLARMTRWACRPIEAIRQIHRRYVAERDAHARIAAYLRLPGFKALHVGCGPRALDAWLNSDAIDNPTRDLFLDLTQPLPLPVDSLDALYAPPHAIAHLPERAVRAFFRESHRVLRPAGVFRVTVPDASAKVLRGGQSWTFESLADALREAGFTTIVRCAPGLTQSPWEQLASLEPTEGRDACNLSDVAATLIVEATAARAAARTTALSAPRLFARESPILS